MASELKLECESCKRRLPWEETENRNDHRVCIDQKACDKADEDRAKKARAELRRTARETGEPLTEAELRELEG